MQPLEEMFVEDENIVRDIFFAQQVQCTFLKKIKTYNNRKMYWS